VITTHTWQPIDHSRGLMLDAPPLRTVCTENGVCSFLGIDIIKVTESPYFAGFRTPRNVSESVHEFDPNDVFSTPALTNHPHWKVAISRYDSQGREWITTVPMVVDCYGDLVEVRP
jgi:hypothetical protein